MAHWSADYIGKEYVIDVYDCLSLVVDVERNVFGHNIDDNEERAKRLIDKSTAIMANIEKYVHPIAAEEAVDGDVVLMTCKGRLNHTGVLAVVNNVRYVVHNLRNVKSVAIHKLRDLEKWNMEIEGFYRF